MDVLLLCIEVCVIVALFLFAVWRLYVFYDDDV